MRAGLVQVNKMRIRKAKLKDLPRIKKISKDFKFELNRDWKNLVNSSNSKMFLAVENNKILGFTGLIYHKWNNTVQISNIFVNPEYRGKGLGLKLVNFLVKKVKKTKYRCLIAEAPSLNPVVKLYKKAGFRKCGYDDRYYSNKGKEIALWMSIDLS